MTDSESHKVFPSSHRGTGNGVAIGLNRIMGIVSAVVGQAANVCTPLSLYLVQSRILTFYIDEDIGSNLYLCCIVHCAGNCGRGFSI